MKKAITLLVVMFAMVVAAQAKHAVVPQIVASVDETTTGNFVVFVPDVDGDYRITMYFEGSDGAHPSCGSASYTDDNSPTDSAHQCSGSNGNGSLVFAFHAKANTNIFVNVDSVTSHVYATLEQF